MLYALHEAGYHAASPMRMAARLTRDWWSSPLNPARDSQLGRSLSAGADLYASVTRRYEKPEWRIDEITVNGAPVRVRQTVVWESPWCRLVQFDRDMADMRQAGVLKLDPAVLIVAPMSGHYATLLRGTIEAFAPDHAVFVTEWVNAREVPMMQGRFDLADFIDHIRTMLGVLGHRAHVVAVCQPGPAVLAAASLMAEDNDPRRPRTMTFMGSPIDARHSPTVTNKLAEERPFTWFQSKMIYTVPPPYPGVGRRVYPGFVQLASFMSMNLERHQDAHRRYFDHLVAGDGDSADKHRGFYDEYLAVMDLTEEFYLQTIDTVFQKYALPKGEMFHRGRLVNPGAVTDIGLMTVEGELDDISGIGQTQAAHELCANLPAELKLDHVQAGVGHYGTFNGQRFRNEIYPKVRDFIRACDPDF